MSRAPQNIDGSESFPGDGSRPVVILGNFDGVHRGHQRLLAEARELAGETGLVCAYTFHPSPRDLMRPGHGIPAVQTVAARVRCLGAHGADVVVIEPFTRDFASQSATWFCEEVLGRRLRASGVVVGVDYRFGSGRAGSLETLRSCLSVPVRGVEDVLLHEQRVSSTWVRQAVLSGDLTLAEELLGRPHEAVGPVVRGDARGRTLGFPTANVAPDTALLPPEGVYAVRAWVNGRWIDGVANLGSRPTVGKGRGSLEVHLFDFQGDLYGLRLRVAFVQFLRKQRAFDGLDALVEQISLDAAAAREALS